MGGKLVRGLAFDDAQGAHSADLHRDAGPSSTSTNGGEILASEQTLAAASGGFATSGARTVNLKGISEPVQVVAVDWH